MRHPSAEEMLEARRQRILRRQANPRPGDPVRPMIPLNRPIKWAYGITTVPSRIDTTLPKTVESLYNAGFDHPTLFVDGCDDPRPYDKFRLPVSFHSNPPMMVARHWILSAWELYLRNPSANRYAIFQDDVLACRHLRDYLDRSKMDDDGVYWNLYTFPENLKLTRGVIGWHKSNQRGLGALGLVFNRVGFQKLLGCSHFIHKPASTRPIEATRKIDGGIHQGMKQEGYIEVIHNPSLIQHQEGKSTLGNRYKGVDSFPGEDYDSTNLLPKESES